MKPTGSQFSLIDLYEDIPRVASVPYSVSATNEHAEARDTAFGRLQYDVGTHGTATYDGTAPSKVLPARYHGQTSFPGMSDTSRAYYTAPDTGDTPKWAEEEAWRWSDSTAGNLSQHNPGAVRGRRMALDVVPQGEVDLDWNINEEGLDNQLTADSLEVTNVNWIPPLRAYEKREGSPGVQGTLPNENWNRYYSGSEQPHRAPELNHQVLPPNSKEDLVAGHVTPNISPVQMSGQLEMFDTPASWHSPFRKADI